MIKVNVTYTGLDEDAVAECNVQEWYHNCILDEAARIACSSQLSELRIGVMLGEIEPFEFEFKGHNIKVDENGVVSEWLKGVGFFDQQMIQMKSLITGKDCRNHTTMTNNED